MNNQLCYIIIVHYSSIEYTKNCIHSINELNDNEYKIVIIDNSCNKKSFIELSDFLQSKKITNLIIENDNEHNKIYNFNYKSIILVSTKNKGYASGINKGIEISRKQENSSKHVCNVCTFVQEDVYFIFFTTMRKEEKKYDNLEKPPKKESE